MSNISETSPILHHNEHEEVDENAQEAPVPIGANDYFRRPLRLLNIVTVSITFLTTVLSTAIYIAIQTGPFVNKWNQVNASGGLALIIFGVTVVTLLTLLIDFPILLSAFVNIISAFYTFAFAIEFFDYTYPSVRSMCSTYRFDGHKRTYISPTQKCIDAVGLLRYFWVACAVFGLIAGALVVTILVVRIVAIARTRFRTRTTIPGVPRVWGSWRNATGFTVHFSFSVIPAGTIPRLVEDVEGGSGRNGRREQAEDCAPLIET